MSQLTATNMPGRNGPALAATREGFARIQFVDWLKENFPDLARAAISHAENGSVLTNGLGQMGPPAPSGGSFWQKLAAGATALGTTYLALKNQREALRINLERAKQGQPPIDMGAAAPVIKTQVDIDPALARRLVSDAGAGLNRTLLMVGGLALAAMLFMGRKK